jgi:predicted RNA-binding protein
MIIPEDERSDKPLVGEKVFSHPDMIKANEYVLITYVAPVRDVCIFVPCAKVKPYHTSPSHKNYDKVILGVLQPEQVHIVTFGTCGVTPRELDVEYPFTSYSFVLGDCNVTSVKKRFIELESDRLYRYLEKTRHNYKHRIAYCSGDFRKAMVKAREMTDIEVVITPKDETLERCRVRGRKFEYGSLSNVEYLRDLKEALSSIYPRAHADFDVEGDTRPLLDNDWYLV